MSAPGDYARSPGVREIYERRYQVFKSLYPALRELFSDLRKDIWDGATEDHDRQDGMKASTRETVTWSVGAGGPDKRV
jgi:hypothetical protein